MYVAVYKLMVKVTQERERVMCLGIICCFLGLFTLNTLKREYIDPFYSGFIVSIIISKVSERRLLKANHLPAGLLKDLKYIHFCIAGES